MWPELEGLQTYQHTEFQNVRKGTLITINGNMPAVGIMLIHFRVHYKSLVNTPVEGIDS